MSRRTCVEQHDSSLLLSSHCRPQFLDFLEETVIRRSCYSLAETGSHKSYLKRFNRPSHSTISRERIHAKDSYERSMRKIQAKIHVKDPYQRSTREYLYAEPDKSFLYHSVCTIVFIRLKFSSARSEIVSLSPMTSFICRRLLTPTATGNIHHKRHFICQAVNAYHSKASGADCHLPYKELSSFGNFLFPSHFTTTS